MYEPICTYAWAHAWVVSETQYADAENQISDMLRVRVYQRDRQLDK